MVPFHVLEEEEEEEEESTDGRLQHRLPVNPRLVANENAVQTCPILHYANTGTDCTQACISITSFFLQISTTKSQEHTQIIYLLPTSSHGMLLCIGDGTGN